MGRLEIATSSISNKPLDYFCKELGVTKDELDRIVNITFPITKEDTKNEPMSEMDFNLLSLFYHMMACYDKSIPSSEPIEGNENNVGFCGKHPDKKLSFICANTECTMKLFCMKCRKDHKKTCTRPEMISTIQMFEDNGFYEEYHEVDESKISEKMEKIDNLGEELKDVFGSFVDVMMKHWKNEILSLSKEPMSKYAQEQLKVKLKKYNGKGKVTTN
jgi:hypothetical protein